MKERKHASKNIEAKKKAVDELADKIKKAKSIVLVDYKGITAGEDTEFRRDFRKAGVEYKILKNSLFGFALKKLNITGFDKDLLGTTSFAFAKDEISGAKIACETAKKLNDKIKVKSGIIDGKYMDATGVAALGSLPSREQMLAKIMGSMLSPVSKLVRTLEAYREKLAVH